MGVFVWLASKGDTSDAFFLLAWGGLQGTHLWSGDSYRLLSALFLHSGSVHLGLNLLGLLVIGIPLERRLGPWPLLLLFFLSGLAGNVVYLAFRIWEPCVGASGAIYGLFGALLAIGRPARPGGPIRARFGRTFLLFSLFVFGTDAATVYLLRFPVALQAHWGGYATGAFLAWALAAPRPRSAFRLASVVAFAVALAAGALYVQRPVFDADYRRYLADREFLLAGPERGREAYRELVDRGDDAAGLRLALACYEAGNLAEARRTLEEEPGDGFEEFVKLDLLVTVLDEMGDRPEADRRFEELVKKSRAWSLANGGGERPADNNFAMHCADHSRRLEEAEVAILGVLLRDIERTYRDTLGWVYLKRGNLKPALTACEAAWEAYPIAEVAYHIAEIHAALGDPERALEWAAEALDPDRHLFLGHSDSTLFHVTGARKLRARLEAQARTTNEPR